MYKKEGVCGVRRILIFVLLKIMKNIEILEGVVQYDQSCVLFYCRTQSIQLLQKLHKAKVFEDVRGCKHNSTEFTDGGRLFRYINYGIL
jgi:uncharacterized protein YlbG (UPF0298 family)